MSPNKWILHCKAYSKKHNLKYKDCIKNADCREAYKSGEGLFDECFRNNAIAPEVVPPPPSRSGGRYGSQKGIQVLPEITEMNLRNNTSPVDNYIRERYNDLKSAVKKQQINKNVISSVTGCVPVEDIIQNPELRKAVSAYLGENWITFGSRTEQLKRVNAMLIKTMTPPPIDKVEGIALGDSKYKRRLHSDDDNYDEIDAQQVENDRLELEERQAFKNKFNQPTPTPKPPALVSSIQDVAVKTANGLQQLRLKMVKIHNRRIKV